MGGCPLSSIIVGFLSKNSCAGAISLLYNGVMACLPNKSVGKACPVTLQATPEIQDPDPAMFPIYLDYATHACRKAQATKKTSRQTAAKYESESELEASSATDGSDVDGNEARDDEVAGSAVKPSRAAASPAKQKGGRRSSDARVSPAEPVVGLLETSPPAKVPPNGRPGKRRGLHSEDMGSPKTAPSLENGGRERTKQGARAQPVSPLVSSLQGEQTPSSPGLKKRSRGDYAGAAERGKTTSSGNTTDPLASGTQSAPSGGDVRPSSRGPRKRPPQGFLRTVRASLAPIPGETEAPTGKPRTADGAENGRRVSPDENEAAVGNGCPQSPGRRGKGGAKAAKAKVGLETLEDDTAAVVGGRAQGQQAKPGMLKRVKQQGGDIDAASPSGIALLDAWGGTAVAVEVEEGLRQDPPALQQPKLKGKQAATSVEAPNKLRKSKLQAPGPTAVNRGVRKGKAGSKDGELTSRAKR